MSDECPECKSQDALGCIEPEIYDGILWWVCNGCGSAYVRESKIEYRTHWATKFVNCWNTARDDASETRAALDAAQDEIERCIEERESQRLLIRQLGAALECVAPAAARLILGGAS